MRRPPLSWIALGTLVLSSLAVIVAAGSTAPAAPAAATTTSSAEASPNSSPPSSSPPTTSGYSANCTTERDTTPAPGVGTTTPYQAGEGGTVKVTRTDQTELEIDSVEANQGWTHTETVPNGQGIKVRFMTEAEPHTRVHLAVTLNNSGTEVHTRVMTCPSQS